MIDTHAHLDALEDAPTALLARAREAGVSRVITDRHRDRRRAAPRSRSPRANDGVYAALGIHPHQAASDEAQRLDELRELLAQRAAVAVGETGLDYYRDYAPQRRAAARSSRRSSRSARELGTAGRDPHARGRRRTPVELSCASTGTVVLHCFSVAGPARGRRSSAAGTSRSPATSRTRRPTELRDAAAAGAGRPHPRRDRQPVPRAAAACAAGRTSRRTSSTRSPRSPQARGEDADELAAQIDANATARLRPAVSGRPKKELGQHFLVDENILGVIGRLAELDPDDVVLEIGPGLGVLTRYLAERVAHVHAVEIDRSLEPHLAAS